MIKKRETTIIRNVPVSPLLTVDEAAEYLSVSKHTIKRWLRVGILQGVKLPGGQWRVLKEQCVDLISKHINVKEN